MTADQLGAHVVQRVGDGEAPVSAQSCDRNTPSNIRSPISPLSSSMIAALGGLDHLVRFLEDEGEQRVERLLAIPRAAGRAAQDLHQRDEGLEGRAGRRSRRAAARARARGGGLGHDVGRDAIIAG